VDKKEMRKKYNRKGQSVRYDIRLHSSEVLLCVLFFQMHVQIATHADTHGLISADSAAKSLVHFTPEILEVKCGVAGEMIVPVQSSPCDDGF
jgi:hypothetical protein